MGSEPSIEFTDALLYEHTGQHLSDLQYCILQHHGKTYRAIATLAGYSEGHVKDVAAQLWRILSDVLGERITKGNYRSRLKYWLKRAKHKVVNKLAAVAPAEPKPQPPTISSVSLAPPPRLSSHFLGRESASATLDSLIPHHRLIVIQGEGGLGKTTLAQHYLQQLECHCVLELMMAKETDDITPVERIVEEWLRQDFNEEPGLDFGVTLDRLRRHLKRERVGILVDNFEPALDADGQLLPAHRRYVELLRVLAEPGVQSITLVTSRDRICEPSIKVYHYRLPGLSLASWQQFFSHHCVTADGDSLRTLHRIYGGNAKAMEILLGTVQFEYDGDLAAYWHTNQTDPLVEIDLKNLVTSQVNRIQQLDPVAYQLLCRLSCYRYQTIARLPLAALTAQMSAVPASQQRQVVASLRNRSLLETHKGQYWLHPAVRAVAMERLQASEQWEIANQSAARYWTRSIQQITTLTDALQALEAYYHHCQIKDYAAAAGVLLNSRHNQWQQYLPLASHLYRMGLLQPIVEAIGQVLPQLQDSEQASELHNILGDIHWIKGEIGTAISCQQRTIATTETLLSKITEQEMGADSHRRLYYLKMLNIDSQLSIGFYKVDLWELETAKQQFEQVIALAKGTAHTSWAEKAEIALALVNAYLGEGSIAKVSADRLRHSLLQQPQTERSGRFAYFIQLLGQTYNCLNELDTAQQLHQQAIAFANASHYLQIKAKALTGLGELHRKRYRFTQAIQFHTQALDLLEKVGARCDLAEAHLQYAVTLRAASNAVSDRASDPKWHFQTALQLFSAIQAPGQILKVQQQISQ
ncbi:MAG: NB-ARC domain-containing protein [Cyanobacteria bacterium P01_D01_bin.14]